MPDEVVGGAVASADPVRDAVANSVADAGMIDEVVASETVAEPVAEPATETSTEPATETSTEPVAKTEDEDIAEIEAKLVAENPSMQRGTIARSRHQAMLPRRANEHKAALEAVQQKYAPFETQETKERLAGAEIFEKHPQVAFEKVLLQDPRYVALIEAEITKRVGARAPAAEPAKTATTPAAEYPSPDALLPDGSLGYSAEALSKIRELDRAAIQADFDKKLDERFKAIDSDLAPAREVRAAKEMLAESYKTQGQLLAEARSTWPAFNEHEKAISAELAKPGNERISLRRAYDNVVYGALTAKVKTQEQMEAEIRTRLIKDTNAAASAAGRTPRPGVPAAGAPGNDGYATDPIRDAVAKAASTLR